MSALILLLAMGLWFGLGWLIWRFVVGHRLKRAAVRIPLGLALAGVWLFAPWADEWLGARKFKRLCDEMPEAKFYGPIAVGAGLFYDEQAQRKLWAQNEIEAGKSPFPPKEIKLAYGEGRKFSDAWQLEFKRTTATRRVRDWPIPILQEVTTYKHAASEKVVLDSHWLGSPGGWVKRLSGWGNHAPYSCVKQNKPYPEETWITY